MGEAPEGEGGSTGLAGFLQAQRSALLARWIPTVRAQTSVETLDERRVIDSLPVFLDEIDAALRGRSSSFTCTREHGVQRLMLGFSAGELVREYGALLDAMLVLAAEHRLSPTLAEHRILLAAFSAGTANAIAEFERVREERIQRQAEEHAAFLAHELRNPLTSARMAFTSLRRQERASLPADQRDSRLPQEARAVEVLDRSLNRLGDLLDHSLIELKLRATGSIRPERFLIAELLHDACGESEVDAEMRSISMTVDADENLEVYADRRLLRSVVTNLTRNAIKFSRQGGHVALRCRCDGGRVLVEVEDECGGLPPALVAEVFSPFVQASADRSGFGLGLAIAKQAAEAHRGSLRVHNLPGKGCMFILELPVRDSFPTATTSTPKKG